MSKLFNELNIHINKLDIHIDKMIEIEDFVNSLNDNIGKQNMIDGISRYNARELDYISIATKLRYMDIKDEINDYDNSNPKEEESAFIKSLCIKYGVKQADMIKRIKQVRLIQKFRNKNTWWDLE